MLLQRLSSDTLTKLEREVAKLLAALRKNGNVLIITHRNADPDALGAALGLRSLISEVMGLKPAIIVPEGLSAASKRITRELNLEYDVFTCEDIDLERITRPKPMTIVVDTSSAEQLGDKCRDLVIKRSSFTCIVDHHEAGDLSKSADITIKLHGARSTSEIAALMHYIVGVEVDPRIATAMIAGIVYDTKRLALMSPTVLAALELLMSMSGDYRKALDMLRSEMDRSEKIARLKAATRAAVYDMNGLIVAVSKVSAFEGSACRALLDLGADVAVVIAFKDGYVRVIGRARPVVESMGLHLGKDIMEELGKRLNGGGGGHALAAGAAGTWEKSSEELVNLVVDLLRKALEEKIGGKVEIKDIR